MICQGCGKTISEDAPECSHCGAVALRTACPGAKAAWGEGTMAVLAFLSIIVPAVGIGAGIYGVLQTPKRSQGSMLLLTGLAMAALQGILIYAVLSGRRGL